MATLTQRPLGSAEARPWHASLPGSLCESSESGLLSSVPGVTGSSLQLKQNGACLLQLPV